MCGVIVIDAHRSRSTWHGRDDYIHNHCLGYRHNFALFYQLLGSNLFTHRNTCYHERSHYWNLDLISYKFLIYNSSLLFCNLYFPIYTTKYQKYLSYYLYQISLSQVTMKGLTTPLSRWLQGSWLFVQVLGDLCVVSYWIDTLVLKTEGNTYATLLHHPFLFKGKTNASSRGSKKDF